MENVTLSLYVKDNSYLRAVGKRQQLLTSNIVLRLVVGSRYKADFHDHISHCSRISPLSLYVKKQHLLTSNIVFRLVVGSRYKADFHDDISHCSRIS
ncbi:MAG: hypothetical protein KAG86_00525, partial [Gammaproteobacteria bacterium]|nr:hypothetical protein [Gammaproteobacteria bacterium]